MKSRKLFEKAESLRNEEKLDQATTLYMEASKLSEQEQNSWILAESTHMLGLIHLQQEEFDEALHCLEGARRLFQKQGDLDMVGAVLRDLAQIYLEQGELELAEKSLQDSINVLEKGQKIGHLGISKVRLGNVYTKRKAYDKAEELMLEGISAIEKSDDRFFESSAYYSLAKLYQEAGKLNDSKSAAEKSLMLLELAGSDSMHQDRKKEIKDFIKKLN